MFSSWYTYFKVSFSEVKCDYSVFLEESFHVHFYNLLYRYLYNNYNLQIDSPFSFAREVGLLFASITGQSKSLKHMYTALFENISILVKEDNPSFVYFVRIHNETNNFLGFRGSFDILEAVAFYPSFVTPESIYALGYFKTEEGYLLLGHTSQIVSYNYEPATLVTWIPPLAHNLLLLFFQDVLIYYKNTEKNLKKETIVYLEKLIAIFTV